MDPLMMIKLRNALTDRVIRYVIDIDGLLKAKCHS